jgi:N-methylhydantoinase A/oxoprolinase/acetone carboxylase beta subunit
MSILLGIDTGGTYTDAVLFDDERGVIRAAKALTTKRDLSIGIRNAMEAALPKPAPEIRLVSLSSTLATNAIVEGKGSRVCLLLIAYDSDMVARAGLERVVASDSIVLIQGGHTVTGEERFPLDINAARQAILSHAPKVAAFAISSFFGVRNPMHELQVKRLARQLTKLPVTCGHELSTHLDAPRRALTAALNARLTPLLQQLILELRGILTSQGIHAPLMVVRGDGSLMDTTMALERPVETILSGPAASVIGARYLSNIEGDAFIIDIGGTTTDIATLHNGRPRLNFEGAWVGGQRTMIEAVDARTIGLGGDSEVHLDRAGNLHVGPRRVIPLSLLAEQYPQVIDVLHRQLEQAADKSTANTKMGRFVTLERSPGTEQNCISSTEQEILRLLNDGPIPLSRLLEGSPEHQFLYQRSLDNLQEHGLVVTSAFTPTDALHVLGQYRYGSVEAAKLGAALWARRLKVSTEEFCKQIVQKVVAQIGQATIATALAEEGGLALNSQDSVGHLFINRALGSDDGGAFAVTLSMRRPIIGVGAPATTYLPPVAAQLHTNIHIPEHAEVASAVGAVATGVVQTIRILIRPLDGSKVFRVHVPFGVRDFTELTPAVSYATDTARRLARHRAHQAGADSIKVSIERHDRTAPVYDNNIHIETEIIATAVGRPGLKE